jgi:cytochrome c
MKKIHFKSFSIATLIGCIVFYNTLSQSQSQENTIPTLLQKYGCLSCHDTKRRLVGPSFNAIAKRKYSSDQMVALILKPEPSNWKGYPPMPIIPELQENDIKKVAAWINTNNTSEE